MKPAAVKALCARARALSFELEGASEVRKALYAERDKIVAELLEVKGPLTHGVRLVDTFEKGNTQWGHGPVSRFSLEVEEPESGSSPAAKKR